SRTVAEKPVSARCVMHVISGLGDGGAERALTNLVLHQRTGEQGAREHIVISLSGAGIYGPVLSSSGIEVIAIDTHRIPSLLGAILRISRMIRNRRPDVLNCWMYHASLVGFVAVLLSR